MKGGQGERGEKEGGGEWEKGVVCNTQRATFFCLCAPSRPHFAIIKFCAKRGKRAGAVSVCSGLQLQGLPERPPRKGFLCQPSSCISPQLQMRGKHAGVIPCRLTSKRIQMAWLHSRCCCLCRGIHSHMFSAWSLSSCSNCFLGTLRIASLCALMCRPLVLHFYTCLSFAALVPRL